MLAKYLKNILAFLFSPLIIFNAAILKRKLPNVSWLYFFFFFLLLANLVQWQVTLLLDNPWEYLNKLLSISHYKKIQVKGTPYDSLINKHSLANDLDPCLVAAVIAQESGFRPKVVSKTGAKGLMQIIPGTWEFLRKKGHIASEYSYQSAFNPEVNIMAGTKYLRMLIDRYQGDTVLALAAYNAGHGNVDKYQGVPPFNETRFYVKRVAWHWSNFRGDVPQIKVLPHPMLKKFQEILLIFNLSLWLLLFFWLYRTHSLFRRY